MRRKFPKTEVEGLYNRKYKRRRSSCCCSSESLVKLKQASKLQVCLNTPIVLISVNTSYSPAGKDREKGGRKTLHLVEKLIWSCPELHSRSFMPSLLPACGREKSKTVFPAHTSQGNRKLCL